MLGEKVPGSIPRRLKLFFHSLSLFIKGSRHAIKIHDPERPEGIDKCTKDEVRGDFLQSPHRHLEPAMYSRVYTMYIHTHFEQKENREVKKKTVFYRELLDHPLF